MRKKIVTDEKAKEIARFWADHDDQTAKQIAARYDLSAMTICRAFVQYFGSSFLIYKSRKRAALYQRICEYYQANPEKTCDEIAKVFRDVAFFRVGRVRRAAR